MLLAGFAVADLALRATFFSFLCLCADLTERFLVRSGFCPAIFTFSFLSLFSKEVTKNIS